MLLRIICTDLNIKLKQKEDSFWRIWELVNKEVQIKFNAGLSLSHEIEPLRIARNSIQHSGTVPSDSDVERFEGYARTFLDNTINKVFSIDYENIKLSELINEVTFRTNLDEAENLIGQKDFLGAIEILSITFEAGRSKAIENIYESKRSKMSASFEFRNIKVALGQDAYRDLINAFEKTEEMFSMLALKLDYREYMNFKNKKFEVFYSLQSKPCAMKSRTDVRTKEDADFCYNFVLNSFIAWEL